MSVCGCTKHNFKSSSFCVTASLPERLRIKGGACTRHFVTWSYACRNIPDEDDLAAMTQLTTVSSNRGMKYKLEAFAVVILYTQWLQICYMYSSVLRV